MNDYAARLADLLEQIATRIRALTVEPAEKAIRIAAFALPAAVLGLLAIVFFFMTIHAALAIPLGNAGAYALVGGVFLAGGAFVWKKRI